jgi:G3E family GTPase
MTTSDPIPLTIIGGYLGAGKTTLLNQLLRHNAGRRLAVLVNDFGSINIDAALIAEHDGETMSLANGCVCCSLAAGFLTVLSRLKERPDPPEHIIVEASGVADPLKVGQYGHTSGFRLDSVLVLADAETVRRRSRDKYVGRTVIRQLRGADIQILTKPDLVSDAERAAVRGWLRGVAPNASIMESENGVIPPALILGTGMHAQGGPSSAVPGGQEEVMIDHEAAYDTWTFEQESPMTDEAMRAFAAGLPEGVLRAKGLVYLAEDPEHATIFQHVGKRWSLTPGPAWDDRSRRTAIVMIGIPGSRNRPDCQSDSTVDAEDGSTLVIQSVEAPPL